MRLVAASLALALSISAAPASANVAAVERHPARVGALATATRSPLRVDHERLTFSCVEVEGAPRCSFEARYTISNPDPVRHEIAAAFFGIRARGVEITIDGSRVAGSLSPAEMEAVRAAAKLPRHFDAHETLDQGFSLVAEPGSKHEIVARGEVDPGLRFIPGDYAMRAVNARHLLVGTRTPERTVFDLEYLIAPIRAWRGDPRIEVKITAPSRWRVVIDEAARAGWSREARGATQELVGSLVASKAPDVLQVEIQPPARIFANGGPLVAVGGTVGGRRGARGRVGYEVAAPSWLLYGATAETNFRDRFILTPTIEAASPAILIIPSFGLGAGVPVQVSPDPRVGVRLQADMHLYALGFVTSVDIYPRFGSRLSGFTEVSLLGQIAF